MPTSTSAATGAINARQGAVDARQGAVDARQGAVNEKVGAVNERVGAVDVGEGCSRRQPDYLQVDHVPDRAVEGLLQGLTQCRVSVHVAGEFLGGQVPLVGQGQLREHLGDVVAHQMSAE